MAWGYEWKAFVLVLEESFALPGLYITTLERGYHSLQTGREIRTPVLFKNHQPVLILLLILRLATLFG